MADDLMPGDDHGTAAFLAAYRALPDAAQAKCLRAMEGALGLLPPDEARAAIADFVRAAGASDIDTWVDRMLGTAPEDGP